MTPQDPQTKRIATLEAEVKLLTKQLRQQQQILRRLLIDFKRQGRATSELDQKLDGLSSRKR